MAEYVPYQSGPVKQPGTQRLNPSKPFELARLKLNGVMADWRPVDWLYDPTTGLPVKVTCYASTCITCGSLCEEKGLIGEIDHRCKWCQPYNRRVVRITGTTS